MAKTLHQKIVDHDNVAFVPWLGANYGRGDLISLCHSQGTYIRETYGQGIVGQIVGGWLGGGEEIPFYVMPNVKSHM